MLVNAGLMPLMECVQTQFAPERHVGGHCVFHTYTVEHHNEQLLDSLHTKTSSSTTVFNQKQD